MPKTRIFVSYDYDNDRTLYALMIGQARLPGSPFEVANHSLKEAAPERNWAMSARMAIRRADRFIVLLGSRTRRASGVGKEVAIAKGLGKTRFQIIGYRSGSRDRAVPDGGATYRWNWDNLRRLLA